MSKIIIRATLNGVGRKIRVDTLKNFQELVAKLTTKFNTEIKEIKDSDGDIIDEIDLLSQGDEIVIIAAPPIATTTAAPSTTDLGTRIMRSLIPQDDQDTIVHCDLSSIRTHILTQLANNSHQDGSTKLLSTLRHLMTNIQTDNHKYMCLSKHKLEKATQPLQVTDELMSSLGFGLCTTTKHLRPKYYYRGPWMHESHESVFYQDSVSSSPKQHVHQPTILAIIQLLDELFVESRQLSQSQVHQSLFSSNSVATSSNSTGETKQSNGTSWSERHQAMAAARQAGLSSPMLSNDRLTIYIDELNIRRNKLFEDNELPSRNIQLFNSGGAKISFENLQDTIHVTGPNSVAELIQEDQEETAETQATEETQETEEAQETEETKETQETQDTIDQQDEKRDRAIRLRMISRRKIMEEKKKDEKRFRSKATRKLEKLQSKDGKYTKSTLKISERNGISISANFSIVENAQDVLDFLIKECLSENGQELVNNNSLQIILETRDPSPNTNGRVANITLATTSASTVATGLRTKSTTDDTSTLLEWNLVPRGRVWLDIYIVEESGKRNKTTLMTYLTDRLKSCFEIEETK